MNNSINKNKIPDKNFSFDDQRQALCKFFYEHKYRKKELFNECRKYDFDFSSRIKKIHFEAILNKFTCYPNKQEKDLILSTFVINDAYVNYLEVSNTKFSEEYIYKDPYLNHLNIFINKYDLRNIPVNIKSISKIVEIKPLDLLNYQILEENFIINTCKIIFDYLVINSGNKNNIDQFFIQLMKNFDFDFDDKFTIGELNNFLLNIGIQMWDYDLRYFFESMQIEEGKISFLILKNFVFTESKKKLGITIDTNFINDKSKLFTSDELKNQAKLQKILSSNYFTQIIKESLQVCGKEFLINYFSKYIEIIENASTIDSVWLEVGYKKLGYKEISEEDIGNFKYYCVKKNLGFLKSDTTLYIKIEMLFSHLIKEFNIQEGKKNIESNFVIKEMSKNILDDLTDNILSYGLTKKSTHNDKSTKFHSFIDEYQFRKNIISKFNFLDHSILDNIIKVLNKESNKIDHNSLNKSDSKAFLLENINTKKWLELGYNYMFMGLIKYSEEFGILLDEMDRFHLNNIYLNIEEKIFPKEAISNKTVKIEKINDISFEIYEDINDNMKEPLNFYINKIEENKKILEDIDRKAGSNENSIFKYRINPSQNNVNLIEFTTKNKLLRIKENEDKSNISIKKDLKYPDNFLYVEKDKNNLININDTANLVPQLFDICAEYIKQKYKLEKISSGLLSKLGCCHIFRDHLINNKINLKQEINFSLLMINLKSITNLSESVYRFLELIGRNYKNKNEFINPLYFFSKLEEILIQFSKININF